MIAVRLFSGRIVPNEAIIEVPAELVKGIATK
jgi:hypothetical protein